MLKKIFDALRNKIIVRLDVVGHIAAFDGTRNHIAYLCKSGSTREVSGVLKVNRITRTAQFIPNLQSYYVMKTVRLAYPGQHEIAVGLPQDVSDNWRITRGPGSGAPTCTIARNCSARSALAWAWPSACCWRCWPSNWASI